MANIDAVRNMLARHPDAAIKAIAGGASDAALHGAVLASGQVTHLRKSYFATKLGNAVLDPLRWVALSGGAQGAGWGGEWVAGRVGAVHVGLVAAKDLMSRLWAVPFAASAGRYHLLLSNCASRPLTTLSILLLNALCAAMW